MDQRTPSEETHHAASNSDSLARLRELFAKVVELPLPERAAWLQLHVSDSGERTAIERLLAADELDSGYLDTPAGEHVAVLSSAESAAADGLVGQSVGPFRLTRLLGRGGMAAVFLGERSGNDFGQQVAVKLLRRGLFSEMEQRLFRRERQLLAALHHPNIAHLIDGGITTAGIPYLVLEYVDGSTIVEYANAQALPARERIALFLVVCRAVEVAHRRLIVHRDIKPSNIMVTRDGIVKLLDFGIAKLIEEDTESATFGVFTPDYAAPEQISGEQITTATDVYSLGILLHELLLGQRPTTQSPRRPSQLATGDTERRLLRGDLDTILLKALAPEPERRYASAATLADDIERQLAGHPVEAHAPSGWYRTRKFVRRHRGGVTVTALLVLSIFVALGAAVWQARVARDSAARANAMRDFMFAAFAESQPGSPRAKPALVADVVERAVAKARNDSSIQPLARTELLTQLGAVLRAQGRGKIAEDNLYSSYRDAQRSLGDNALATLEAGHELMFTLIENDKLVPARSLGDELLQRLPASELSLRSRILRDQATISTRLHDIERARREISESVRLARAGNDQETLRYALEGLGNVQLSSNDFDGAIHTYSELLLQYQKAFGPQHLYIAETEAGLSRAYRRAGNLDAAEAHARSALAIDAAVLGNDDWRRAVHLNALMAVLYQRRDFQGALEAAKEGLRISRIVYGEHDSTVANDLNSVGWMNALLENYSAAVAPLRESTEIASDEFGVEHHETAVSRENYGWALAMSGNLAEGERELRHAIVSLGADKEPDFNEIGVANEKLARIAVECRHDGAAAKSAVDAAESAIEKLKSQPEYWNGRVDALRAQVSLLNSDSAAARDQAASAATALTRSEHPDVVLSVLIPLLRAQAADKLGDSAEARKLAAEGRQKLATLRNPPSRIRQLAAALP